MHDSKIVRRLQRVRHLQKDRSGSRHRERTLAREQPGERLAFHELHGEVDQTLRRLAEVVNGTDGGVSDAAGVRRLAVEARHCVGVVHHRGVHHLDGAPAPHLHVLREVHLPHPALAELLHDMVAVGHDLVGQIVRRR